MLIRMVVIFRTSVLRRALLFHFLETHEHQCNNISVSMCVPKIVVQFLQYTLETILVK